MRSLGLLLNRFCQIQTYYGVDNGLPIYEMKLRGRGSLYSIHVKTVVELKVSLISVGKC